MYNLSKKIAIVLSILMIIMFSANLYFAYCDEPETASVVEESPQSSTSLSNLSSSSVTSVTSVNSYEQANLSLNNILCIILISIGILLILFAIAILIRLKSTK